MRRLRGRIGAALLAIVSAVLLGAPTVAVSLAADEHDATPDGTFVASDELSQRRDDDSGAPGRGKAEQQAPGQGRAEQQAPGQGAAEQQAPGQGRA
ncbi:MAG: hypothetical protein M3O70_24615, partial [Actinomycetota bacterium]|nr:hypothetical protein [Actinomycetota bacterium]